MVLASDNFLVEGLSIKWVTVGLKLVSGGRETSVAASYHSTDTAHRQMIKAFLRG